MASTPDAKIIVHWLNKSRSQRILWLLEELEVPYELKVYERGKDMLAPAELKKVHPLGKSPTIAIEVPNEDKHIVIAESGLIVEYILEHFGGEKKGMIPARWQAGKEGQVAGETEAWMRYRYYLHYAEGSLMGLMMIALFINQIRDSPVPFFVKPVTRGIATRVYAAYLTRNFETHFAFLEGQLKTAPSAEGGPFFAGNSLTGADILLIYPLEAGGNRVGLSKEKHPELCAYIERMQQRPAYKKAVQRIVDETGGYDDQLGS